MDFDTITSNDTIRVFVGPAAMARNAFQIIAKHNPTPPHVDARTSPTSVAIAIGIMIGELLHASLMTRQQASAAATRVSGQKTADAMIRLIWL